jgi:predicted lactoylglutathione lyase
MSEPTARLTLVTICVRDLAASTAFYEALGFRRKERGLKEVAFFEAGGVILGLWTVGGMEKDANIEIDPSKGFRPMSLAWNCASPEEVDMGLARAVAAGAKVLRKAEKAFWGGYTAYFADPDEHIWEIAHNPGWPLTADGRVTLPD